MLKNIYAASLSFATNTLHLFIMNKYNYSFCLPNVITTQKKKYSYYGSYPYVWCQLDCREFGLQQKSKYIDLWFEKDSAALKKYCQHQSQIQSRWKSIVFNHVFTAGLSRKPNRSNTSSRREVMRYQFDETNMFFWATWNRAILSIYGKNM